MDCKVLPKVLSILLCAQVWRWGACPRAVGAKRRRTDRSNVLVAVPRRRTQGVGMVWVGMLTMQILRNVLSVWSRWRGGGGVGEGEGEKECRRGLYLAGE